MNLDNLTVPEFDMPPHRAEIRRQALVREARGGSLRRPPRAFGWWPVVVPWAATLVLGAVLLVAYVTPERPSPMASWTAVPAPLHGEKAAEAEELCRDRLAGERWPISVSAMTGVLAERRGTTTAVMMSGSNQYGACVGEMRDPFFTGVGEVGGFDPADGVSLDGSPGQLNGANAFRLAYGQVSAETTGVVITTADGRLVEATVRGGRFFAWWPSGADATKITAMAADGRVLGTIHPDRTAVPQPPIRGS